MRSPTGFEPQEASPMGCPPRSATMNPDVLLFVMTLFVGVATVALLLQLFTLFALFKAVKSLQEQALGIMPQVKSILTKAEYGDAARRCLAGIGHDPGIADAEIIAAITLQENSTAIGSDKRLRRVVDRRS